MTAESDSKITENPDSIHLPLPSDPSINLISPLSFLRPSDDSSHLQCLLILNQPIRLDTAFFTNLWNSTSLHICADGGANRLLEYSRIHPALEKCIPDYIIGDLDSLKDDVKDFYVSKGTKLKKQASQYYSDLDKSISLINVLVNFPSLDIYRMDDYNELEETEKKETERAERIEFSDMKDISVLVVGGIGGRFDQTIATISRTVQSFSVRPFITFMLLNSEHPEFVVLVPRGKNFISYERTDDGLRNVGLIPFSGPVSITTRGLKWDVRDWETKITGDLSLCNLQTGEEGIYIETSGDLFVNIEFDEPLTSKLTDQGEAS
ncbi:DEKNAAC105286 [Brettanomyces naardenensis]|uniref:Thiamine pyrophosphokinase n=1 Tax=Brettanomyces naardenensis TaxID=13370 RepID=A0A448YSV2_BRENA|nr:DEKNAAC105286 [Brettanomyces naardenensis]